MLEGDLQLSCDSSIPLRPGYHTYNYRGKRYLQQPKGFANSPETSHTLTAQALSKQFLFSLSVWPVPFSPLPPPPQSILRGPVRLELVTHALSSRRADLVDEANSSSCVLYSVNISPPQPTRQLLRQTTSSRPLLLLPPFRNDTIV